MRRFLPFIIIVFFYNCSSKSNSSTPEYKYSLDEILLDPTIDGDFEICNKEHEIFQYFNDSKGLKIKGEKKTINNHFIQGYITPDNSTESGLIRIRFIVNCKGEAGRYRLLSMDKDYNESVFDAAITDQLMNLTKSLQGWGTLEWKEQKRDYYQYLIFKIKDGKIVNRLP